MSEETLVLSEQDLAKLVREPESWRVEFLRELTGKAPERIRETVCSFANDLPAPEDPE